MKKISHSNTTKQNVPSKLFEEVFDIFTLKMKPISITFVEQLGQQFVKYALEDDNALKAMAFFRAKGYGTDDIRRWKERSIKFASAYELGKEIIGDRREIGGLKKKYDAGMITTSMPIYDREWKEQAEWKANLTKEKEQPTTKIVVIEKFGESHE